ncbi:hypothetical protein SO802_020363 [Lithocarpus litseifolius]|uniref:Uncharacterized protein n=1 Tax=Lithocarpus litseifolius TaxID=425828 RepID=A0AAW2CDS9_9ROSI
MMTSFSPKLMTAVVILLLVGDFPATSAGCRKSLWHVSETESRDDLMKMVPREEGSSECLNIKVLIFSFPIEMSGFQAKLMAAAVALFLLLGDFPAIPASVPHGGGMKSWHVSDSRDGSMKTVFIEENNSQGLNINGKTTIASALIEEGNSQGLNINGKKIASVPIEEENSQAGLKLNGKIIASLQSGRRLRNMFYLPNSPDMNDRRSHRP